MVYALLVFMSGDPSRICFDEIRQHAQHIGIILGSVVNIIGGGDLCDCLKRKNRLYFWLSTPCMKVGTIIWWFVIATWMRQLFVKSNNYKCLWTRKCPHETCLPYNVIYSDIRFNTKQLMFGKDVMMCQLHIGQDINIPHSKCWTISTIRWCLVANNSQV